MKPRLRRVMSADVGQWVWQCEGDHLIVHAPSVQAAFMTWQHSEVQYVRRFMAAQRRHFGAWARVARKGMH